MKKYFVLIFSVVVVVIAAVLTLSRSRSAVVYINNATIVVIVADDVGKWEKGLSGMQSLENDRGMLFVFPDSQRRLFWMRGMKFPIDIIWIRDGRVVGITKNVLPPTDDIVPDAWSPGPVSMVLEVPANFSDQYRIATGTELSIH